MGEQSQSEAHILNTLLAVMHGQLVTILAPNDDKPRPVFISSPRYEQYLGFLR